MYNVHARLIDLAGVLASLTYKVTLEMNLRRCLGRNSAR